MPVVLDRPAPARAAPPTSGVRGEAEGAVSAPSPAAPVAPPDLHLPAVGPGRVGLTVPGGALTSAAAFRRWKTSDDCPGWGKFEWIGNQPRLELMPESLFTHGSPKLRVAGALDRLVEAGDLGYCFTDSTTVTSPDGHEPAVNCEPDFVFLSYDAVRTGRVALTPKADRPDDAIEIVGPPEVVLEVRSDGSTRKDTVDLPADLFALGVTEYWLVDARRDPAALTLHARGDGAFEPAAADADGFALSGVFGRRFRLDTRTDPLGRRQVRLTDRDG